MFDAVKVRDLFDRAVQLPSSDRAAFLERACPDDASLRDEVRRLIVAHDGLGDMFETVHDASDRLGRFDEPAVPEVIGAYRLVREIGSGGAGTVYLAARDDDEFQKAVAVKLLRPGIDSADLVRRLCTSP
jgi:serine/threonine protein kinase